MVTYFELKHYIGRIFGQKDLEDNDNDIYVNLSERENLSDENTNTCIISNTELKALYDKVSNFLNDNLEFVTLQNYEVAVNMEYPFLYNRSNYSIVTDDSLNGIKYTLDFPSIEYCIFLIIKIIDNYKMNNKKSMLPIRLHRSINYWNRRYNNQEVTFQNILPQIINGLSLKIETDKPTNLSDFRDYKTSFFFNLCTAQGMLLLSFLISMIYFI